MLLISTTGKKLFLHQTWGGILWVTLLYKTHKALTFRIRWRSVCTWLQVFTGSWSEQVRFNIELHLNQCCYVIFLEIYNFSDPLPKYRLSWLVEPVSIWEVRTDFLTSAFSLVFFGKNGCKSKRVGLKILLSVHFPHLFVHFQVKGKQSWSFSMDLI